MRENGGAWQTTSLLLISFCHPSSSFDPFCLLYCILTWKQVFVMGPECYTFTVRQTLHFSPSVSVSLFQTSHQSWMKNVVFAWSETVRMCQSLQCSVPFNLTLQIQLQQFADPESSRWNVPTKLVWAGPGKLADTPSEEKWRCYSRCCDCEEGNMS